MAYEDPEDFDFNRRLINHRQDTNGELYTQLSPVPIEDLTEAQSYALRTAVMVWLDHNAGNRPVYVKTHCANVTVDHIPMIPPSLTESALYIVRDPRDVAVSLADHHGTSIDEAIVRLATSNYGLIKHGGYQHVGSWSQNVSSWNREFSYSRFVLRYEDLREDPEHWFRAVLEFFGFIYDEARFRDALGLTSLEALRAQEAAKGFNTKSPHQKVFFREGKVGGLALSDAQAAQIVADHGKVMGELGYAIY